MCQASMRVCVLVELTLERQARINIDPTRRRIISPSVGGIAYRLTAYAYEPLVRFGMFCLKFVRTAVTSFSEENEVISICPYWHRIRYCCCI